MRYGELSRRLREGSGPPLVADWAGDLLASVASGGRDVPAVRHPLGFLCLPLERSGRLGVCVHVWSPELPPPQAVTSPWHCHSWDLLSLVLYGRIRNEVADVTDDEAGELKVFEVASSDGVDDLRATGRTVRAVTSDGGTFGTGEVYDLPAGVFHQTVADGEAATVALGAERTGGQDLSLGPPDLPAHRMRRLPSPAAETSRLAGRAAQLLARAAS